MVDDLLRAWTQWMDSGGMVVLVLLPLVAPPVVLVHELGHAAAALILTDGPVHVCIGRDPVRLRVRVGRLSFALNPIPVPGGIYGVVLHVRVGVSRSLAITLAGPVANGLLAVALLPSLWLLDGFPRAFLGLTAVASFLMAIFNLVPWQAAGWESDGAIIRRSLVPTRRELHATVARWLRLYTNERSEVRTPGRAARLSIMPRLMQLEPGSDAWNDAFRLAFAGWCWREVARDAPAQSAADLAAVASLTADVPPTLRSAAVAHKLVRRGVDLGRVDAAFDELPRPLPTSLDEDQRRFAFRFGVALHDAERFVATAAEHAEAS